MTARQDSGGYMKEKNKKTKGGAATVLGEWASNVINYNHPEVIEYFNSATALHTKVEDFQKIDIIATYMTRAIGARFERVAKYGVHIDFEHMLIQASYWPVNWFELYMYVAELTWAFCGYNGLELWKKVFYLTVNENMDFHIDVFQKVLKYVRTDFS